MECWLPPAGGRSRSWFSHRPPEEVWPCRQTLSSDPRTLSLDSRPPGTARINFIYFPTRTHCSLSLALVSFTHPGLIFCPLSILLTSVSDCPGQQQREKRRGRESWSLRDTIRSWHFCPQVRQVFQVDSFPYSQFCLFFRDLRMPTCLHWPKGQQSHPCVFS